MTEVRMSFHLRLVNSQINEAEMIVGPLFNRFVPDGQNDAIFLTPDDDPHRIQVWFERNCTKNIHGFLCREHNGLEFDESIMRRQEKLDAGQLHGEMLIPDVPDNEMASLFVIPRN